MPKAPITRLSSVSVDASYNTNPGNRAGNGFYVPQLTATQMNATTPQNGGLIYNTTAGTFYSYDGGWIPLAVAGGGVGGPGTSVVGDIAVFANATGNLIADSGVQITQVPPALASTSLVDVNEIRNLGYIQFTNDTGVILVDAIAAVQFINNDPSTGVLPTTIFNPTLTGSTSVSAVVEIQGSDGVFLMSRLTTAERDLLNQLQPGMLFYNTDLNLLQFRNGTTWQSVGFVFVDTGGGTSYNLFLGIAAGPALPANYGTYNIAIGYSTLTNNTTGSSNVAIADSALVNNTTGSNNISLGYQSLLNNQGGANNIAIGTQALQANTGSNDNIAIGYQALFFNTGTAISNIAIGTQALQANASGRYNIALGYKALTLNNTSSRNIAIGYEALTANTGTGSDNIAMGYQALYMNITSINNIAIGSNALRSSTSGHNIAIGYDALTGNLSGSHNIAIGEDALKNNANGLNNIAVGTNALELNTADHNVAVGFDALITNSTGGDNVGIGYFALKTNTTGGGNIGIGYQADVASNALTNAVAIGTNSVVASSNSIVLGALGTNVGINTATPLANFHNAGGAIINRTAVTGAPLSYDVLPSDQIIGVDTTGAVTINLPVASAANIGQIYTIKDEGGNAFLDPVTVAVTGGGNIDNHMSIPIASGYGFVNVYSNGIQWYTR